MTRARFFVLLTLLTTLPAFGAEDAKVLVHRMVQNELAARNDHSHWMYIDSMSEDGTTKVTLVVESAQGSLELLLSHDGRTVSKEDLAKEEAQVKNAIDHPSNMKKTQKADQEDEDQATKMLKMLPDGFLYTVVSDDGHEVKLHFEPNPDFDPPTREAKVFHAMAGEMTIAKKEGRLAGLSGSLETNVYFGWGILGAIRKGGTFEIRQKEVGPGHWELTLLDVHIQGKALFFKTIHEQQHEIQMDYHQIPSDLTAQQAYALLTQHAEEKASLASVEE